jgi:hypothetical protein
MDSHMQNGEDVTFPNIPAVLVVWWSFIIDMHFQNFVLMSQVRVLIY